MQWRHPAGKSWVTPELLPTQYPLSDWDGSQPTLVISWQEVTPGHLKFSGAIEMPKLSLRHNAAVNQTEVDLSRGIFVLRQTDLFIADDLPLSLTRAYDAWDPSVYAFGQGTNHPYDVAPTGTRNPYTYMDLILEDGRSVHFDRISKGTDYNDAVFEHHATSSEFSGSRISWARDGGWDLHLRDGSKYFFPEAYNAKSLAQGAAWNMRDGLGHAIEFRRDDARNLKELKSSSGHWIRFGYDGSNRILEATDDSGNLRRYSYYADWRLGTVSDKSRVLYAFSYASILNAVGFPTHLMSSINDGWGKPIVENEYSRGQISQQKLADGSVYRYKYVVDSNNNVVSTFVTFPDGHKRQFNFQNGRLISSR